MKNLVAIAAVSLMLSSAAMAVCPCQPQKIVPCCPTGYAAPIVRTVQVAPQPCCNAAPKEKKSFFGNIFDRSRSVYNATVGNFMGSMFGYW